MPLDMNMLKALSGSDSGMDDEDVNWMAKLQALSGIGGRNASPLSQFISQLASIPLYEKMMKNQNAMQQMAQQKQQLDMLKTQMEMMKIPGDLAKQPFDLEAVKANIEQSLASAAGQRGVEQRRQTSGDRIDKFGYEVDPSTQGPMTSPAMEEWRQSPLAKLAPLIQAAAYDDQGGKIMQDLVHQLTGDMNKLSGRNVTKNIGLGGREFVQRGDGSEEMMEVTKSPGTAKQPDSPEDADLKRLQREAILSQKWESMVNSEVDKRFPKTSFGDIVEEFPGQAQDYRQRLQMGVREATMNGQDPRPIMLRIKPTPKPVPAKKTGFWSRFSGGFN